MTHVEPVRTPRWAQNERLGSSQTAVDRSSSQTVSQSPGRRRAGRAGLLWPGRREEHRVSIPGDPRNRTTSRWSPRHRRRGRRAATSNHDGRRCAADRRDARVRNGARGVNPAEVVWQRTKYEGGLWGWGSKVWGLKVKSRSCLNQQSSSFPSKTQREPAGIR